MENESEKNAKEVYNVSEVGSMIEALTGTIDLMNESITSRLDSIDGRLDGVENRLDGVEKKVDILQEDVTEIKHKLSEKVDREEFNALEKRMIKLERMVFSKG